MAWEVLKCLVQQGKTGLGRSVYDRTKTVGTFAAKGVDPGGIKGDAWGYARLAPPHGFVLQEPQVYECPAFDPSEKISDFKGRGHEERGGEIPDGSSRQRSALAGKGPGGDDRIEKEADLFSPPLKGSVQFSEPGFVKRQIVPGNHAAKPNLDAGAKTGAQEMKSPGVALIAKEVVDRSRAVQADFKTEPGIEKKRIRQPARNGAAGHNLYLAGMTEG